LIIERNQEKKPMTEEEARPENTQRGASQSGEKPESQKSLTDKISSLFAGTLSFKQTKEQKTMANNEETRPENTQSPLEASFQSCEDPSNLPKTPIDLEQAKQEFIRIKTALIGPKPEWCLPKVDLKAKKTVPIVDDCVLTRSCKPPIVD
jgi:hypothetical protein